MKIASISENKKIEKRIAITPEVAKKYINNGFKVTINKSYGEHLGFFDNEYESVGVSILENENDVITTSEIMVQLGLPSEDKIKIIERKSNFSRCFKSISK